MKKELSIALALCLALSVSACGKADSSTDASSSAKSDTSASETQAQRVEPLPGASIDTENPADGTYAVSFSSADVIDDGGLLELHFTVYDYALYDAVQISQLAAGDTLVVDGEDMAVESVEQTNGGVAINGGLENGGVDLAPGEGGTYYISQLDDAKDYQSIGEATLPVSQDFVLTDDSDLSNPGQKLLSGDLFNLEDDACGFTANNTTLTVKDGYVVAAHRVYVP